MPNLNGILETPLYVNNIKRSTRFYKTIFNFELMEGNQRIASMKVKEGQVLLIIKKRASLKARKTSGGVIPPTDGDGELHLAFSIPKSELNIWEKWLIENDVPIESKVRWDRAGKGIYFRDPDNHLLELASPGVWSNY